MRLLGLHRVARRARRERAAFAGAWGGLGWSGYGRCFGRPDQRRHSRQGASRANQTAKPHRTSRQTCPPSSRDDHSYRSTNSARCSRCTVPALRRLQSGCALFRALGRYTNVHLLLPARWLRIACFFRLLLLRCFLCFYSFSKVFLSVSRVIHRVRRAAALLLSSPRVLDNNRSLQCFGLTKATYFLRPCFRSTTHNPVTLPLSQTRRSV